MTKFGYLIYVIRAHERYDRERVSLQLDALNGAGDLLHGFHARLRDLEDDRIPVKDERYEQAFSILEVEPAGRRVFFGADAGGYGHDGSNTNVDTGSRRPFGDRDASMTTKRAMAVIFRDADAGLLFVERRGGSHLKNHIEDSVVSSCRRHFGVTITVNPYADIDAWRAFLEGAEGYEVRSVWAPRTVEQQVAGSTRSEGELKMTLTGLAASAAYRQGIREPLRRRLAGGDDAHGVEIRTPTSLRPADENGFVQRRLEVQAGADQDKRRGSSLNRRSCPHSSIRSMAWSIIATFAPPGSRMRSGSDEATGGLSPPGGTLSAGRERSST